MQLESEDVTGSHFYKILTNAKIEAETKKII